MTTLDYNGLSNVGKVVEGLGQLLADYQVAYTNLRGMHWNIKGKQFFLMHEEFENTYNDFAEKIDEIAERILMLGGVPAHNFSDYLKTSTIKESGIITEAEPAIKNILETFKVLIAKQREILAAAGEVDDEATVALMGDYISGQEKTVWMLVAYFS